MGVECGAQRGLRGADAHDRAGTGELGQRSVGDQPSGDQHDDVVDGLGHFGQQMAGDQHGASRGGIATQKSRSQRTPSGSRPLVGSSSTRISGSPSRAAAARAADACPARSRRRAAGRRRSTRRRRAPRRRDRRAHRRWRRGRAGARGPGARDGSSSPRARRRCDGSARRGRGRADRRWSPSRPSGHQPEQHPQGRRLPGAVRTEEPDDTARARRTVRSSTATTSPKRLVRPSKAMTDME